MISDPVVDEVRAARDAIAREHDYDINLIFQAFREAEALGGKEHVTHPPRLAVEPVSRRVGNARGG